MQVYAAMMASSISGFSAWCFSLYAAEWEPGASMDA